MRTTVRRNLMVGLGALSAVAIVGRKTAPGRVLRRGVDLLARRLRYAQGRLEGIRYRLAGRTPDPGVSDDVLADRIRSSLGSLEKRLDLPRIHVMVDDHVAILHGEIPAATDAAAIERAVSDITGVCGVESYLHVGLGAEETRPSAGRAQAAATPSPALRELLEAAERAGAT
ncbi:MAG: BON domain-containing protein, partial [Dehalococcoidia bacterium]